MDSPLLRARAPCAPSPVDGQRARACRVAVPPARVVAAVSIPPAARARLSALAHAHRVRRLRRGAAGGRRDPLRAVGGERAMSNGEAVALANVADAAELARLAKA